MARIFFLLLFLSPSFLFAEGWDIRLGVSSFPLQNTLLGVEVTRILDLTEDMEIGLGGVIRTDFSQTVGPGALARYRYWFDEHFEIGAVGEFGYMYQRSFSNPNSYSYFFVGPLVGTRIKPFFLQWEPGVLFYQSTSTFVPLRLVFGLMF